MSWRKTHDGFDLGRGCEVCGLPLRGVAARDNGRKRFCSYACMGKGSGVSGVYASLPLKRVVCSACSKEFDTRAARGKFCSDLCCKREQSRAYTARRATLEGYIAKLRHRAGRKRISQDYLVGLYRSQQGRCALSGIMMTWVVNSGRIPTNISIDRINAKGEYLPGNIQLVCHEINVMRRDLTIEEFRRWCLDVVMSGPVQSGIREAA